MSLDPEMTLGASRRGLGVKVPPAATLTLACEIPKKAQDACMAELIAIATLRVDNTHVLGEFLNESDAVGKIPSQMPHWGLSIN